MIRGQRVELDLGSDDEQDTVRPAILPAAFVGNVLERQPAASRPPVAPVIKNKTGFPEHRKRNAVSRFKQQKASDSSGVALPPLSSTSALSANRTGSEAKSWEEEEKERIDQENRQKLASMSSEEIEEERRELMQSLNPALLQRLLQRSNIESGSAEQDLAPDAQHVASHPPPRPSQKTPKTVSFKDPRPDDVSEAPAQRHDHGESQHSEPPSHDSIHFPLPSQPPELDPSSSTFFEDLHQKYFPSLPSDPDKLEWMQSSARQSDSYDPSAPALGAKDIRFSFKGELIPPRTAAAIPVTAGLHHHGDAPDAAGYTVAELAHLSRSSFAAQRCIAFQTLGRLLYRLGKGEFGDTGEPGADSDGAADTFGELARGLWREVDRTQVIQILVDESEGRGVGGGKHMSSKAYATEAVWLWRKGGGRTWKAE